MAAHANLRKVAQLLRLHPIVIGLPRLPMATQDAVLTHNAASRKHACWASASAAPELGPPRGCEIPQVCGLTGVAGSGHFLDSNANAIDGMMVY